MPIETMLIVLDNKASNDDISRIISIIKKNNGKIEAKLNNGYTFLVNIDNILIEKLRKQPKVNHVGGVTINR